MRKRQPYAPDDWEFPRNTRARSTVDDVVRKLWEADLMLDRHPHTPGVLATRAAIRALSKLVPKAIAGNLDAVGCLNAVGSEDNRTPASLRCLAHDIVKEERERAETAGERLSLPASRIVQRFSAVDAGFVGFDLIDVQMVEGALATAMVTTRLTALLLIAFPTKLARIRDRTNPPECEEDALKRVADVVRNDVKNRDKK